MNTSTPLQLLISNVDFQQLKFRKVPFALITKAILNHYHSSKEEDKSSKKNKPLIDQLPETSGMTYQDWLDYFKDYGLFSDQPHLNALNFLIHQWIKADPDKAYALFLCRINQTDLPRTDLLAEFFELCSLHPCAIDLTNQILAILIEEIPDIKLLPYYEKLRESFLAGHFIHDLQNLRVRISALPLDQEMSVIELAALRHAKLEDLKILCEKRNSQAIAKIKELLSLDNFILKDDLVELVAICDFPDLIAFFISQVSNKPESLSQENLENHFEFLLTQTLNLKKLDLLFRLLDTSHFGLWFQTHKETGTKFLIESLDLILTTKTDSAQAFLKTTPALLEQILSKLFVENHPSFSSLTTFLGTRRISTQKIKTLENLHELRTHLNAESFNEASIALKKIIENTIDPELEPAFFDLITQFYNQRKKAALDSLRFTTTRSKKPSFQTNLTNYLLHLCASKNPYLHFEMILEISKITKVTNQTLLNQIANLIKVQPCHLPATDFESLQKIGLEYLNENQFPLTTFPPIFYRPRAESSENAKNTLEQLGNLSNYIKNDNIQNASITLKQIIENPIAVEFHATLFNLITQFYNLRKKAVLNCLSTSSNRKQNPSFQANIASYLIDLCHSQDLYLHLEKILEVSTIAQVFNPKLTQKIFNFITAEPHPKKKEGFESLLKKGLKYFEGNKLLITKNHAVSLLLLCLNQEEVNFLAYLLSHYAALYANSLPNQNSNESEKKLTELLHKCFSLLANWEGQDDVLKGFSQLLNKVSAKRRPSFTIPFINLCLKLHNANYYPICLKLLCNSIIDESHDQKEIYILQQKIFKDIASIDNPDITIDSLIEMPLVLLRTCNLLLEYRQEKPQIEIMPIVEALLRVIELCEEKGVSNLDIVSTCGNYLKKAAKKSPPSTHFNPTTIIKLIELLLNMGEMGCIAVAENCFSYENIKNSLGSESGKIKNLILLKKLETILKLNPFINLESRDNLITTLHDFIKHNRSDLLSFDSKLWRIIIACAIILRITHGEEKVLPFLTKYFLQIEELGPLAKQTFLIECDRKAIESLASIRTARHFDRYALLQDQYEKMTKLALDLEETLSHSTEEESIEHRHYFATAFNSLILSISPRDPLLGKIQTDFALEFLENAWKRKLLKSPKNYLIFKTYLTGKEPDISQQLNVLKNFCLNYICVNDPSISSYLLHQILGLQSQLTTPLILQLITKYRSLGALEFSAISRLLIHINSEIKKTPELLSPADKVNLRNFTKFFTIKLRDDDHSLEFFNIWAVLIKTLIDWKIYDDDYDFFRLMITGAQASIPIIKNLSPKDSITHPSLVIYSLIEKDLSKQIESFIDKREDFIHHWLELLKKEGVLNKELSLVPLLVELKSTSAIELFRDFKNAPSLTLAKNHLLHNLTFANLCTHPNFKDSLRDFFPQNEKETAHSSPSTISSQAPLLAQKEIQKMLEQSTPPYQTAKLLADYMSRFNPNEASRLFINLSLTCSESFSEICLLCFNYLKENPIENLEKLFIILSLNQKPNLNQWLQVIQFIYKTDQISIWDKFLKILEKKKSLSFLLKQLVDSSVISTIFQSAIHCQRTILLEKLLVGYSDELMKFRIPNVAIAKVIEILNISQNHPNKLLLKSLNNLIINLKSQKFDFSLISSFTHYCLKFNDVIHYRNCLILLSELIEQPTLLHAKKIQKLLEEILSSINNANLNVYPQVELDKLAMILLATYLKSKKKVRLNLTLCTSVMFKLHNTLKIESYTKQPYLLEGMVSAFSKLLDRSQKLNQRPEIDSKIALQIITELLISLDEEHWEDALLFISSPYSLNNFSESQKNSFYRKYHVNVLGNALQKISSTEETDCISLPNLNKAKDFLKGDFNEPYMNELIQASMASLSIHTAIDLNGNITETSFYKDYFADISGLSPMQRIAMCFQSDRVAFHCLLNHPKRHEFYQMCHQRILNLTEDLKEMFHEPEVLIYYRSVCAYFTFLTSPHDPTLGQHHTENCIVLIEKALDYQLLPENHHFTKMLKFYLDPFSSPTPTNKTFSFLISSASATSKNYQGITTHILYLLSRNPAELSIELMIKFINFNSFGFSLIDFVAISQLLCGLTLPTSLGDFESSRQTLFEFSTVFLENIFTLKHVESSKLLSVWFSLINQYADWGLYKGHSTSYARLLRKAMQLYFVPHLHNKTKQRSKEKPLVSEDEFFFLIYFLLENPTRVCDSKKHLNQRDKLLKYCLGYMYTKAQSEAKDNAMFILRKLLDTSPVELLPKLREGLNLLKSNPPIFKNNLEEFYRMYFSQYIELCIYEKLFQHDPQKDSSIF